MAEHEKPLRILEYHITENDDGLVLKDFLKNRVKLSKRQVSSLKYREDGLVLNGEPVRVTRLLSAGDVLKIGLKTAGSLYLDHGSFDRPLDIIYEDEDLLAVNKPAGMVCHPSPGHYADSLANQAAAYCAEKGEDWTIRIFGRLDKDTSGIVLFAKNSEAAALLEKQRAAGLFRKTYTALVSGVVAQDEGFVDVPIGNDETLRGKMKADPEGKPARTFWQVLSRGKDATLLSLTLEHGRTHQIRVHMAYAGHPLIGDALYGDGIQGETHAMLCATSLAFSQPFTEKPLLLTVPCPFTVPSAE